MAIKREELKIGMIIFRAQWSHGAEYVVDYIGGDLVVIRDTETQDEDVLIPEHFQYWSIKKPNRELIELYESLDVFSFKVYCDKEGNYADFKLKLIRNSHGAIIKRNILTKNPVMAIDAETFEIVWSEIGDVYPRREEYEREN